MSPAVRAAALAPWLVLTTKTPQSGLICAASSKWKAVVGLAIGMVVGDKMSLLTTSRWPAMNVQTPLALKFVRPKHTLSATKMDRW